MPTTYQQLDKDYQAARIEIIQLRQQNAALRRALIKAKPIVDLMQTTTIGPEIDAALQLTSDGDSP